jgi:crossover junction endodeoxyribonuclease RuvC
MRKTSKLALGIDPGFSGAFVLTDGDKFFEYWRMPLVDISGGKEKQVEFDGVHELLDDIYQKHRPHVFLERAIPMAMGSKGAFNYGRGFAALEIAIELIGMPVTYVEPSKWAKQMHEGLSADLRPKAKSLMAVKRLFPRLVEALPRNKKGALLDGPVDALLIAGYGLRRHRPAEEQDFY